MLTSKNVQRTSRKKIPFGIGQIGKSFRNEITPGNFTFRTREFEQMELEFFCEPGTDLEWFQYWRAFCRDWLLSLGIKEDEMRCADHLLEDGVSMTTARWATAWPMTPSPLGARESGSPRPSRTIDRDVPPAQPGRRRD